MLKALLPAAIASILFASSAWAAPPASTLTGLTQSTTADVIQVQRERAHRHRTHRHSHRAGRRYRNAPRGWHRHSRRPHDWSRRGCIIVGPVWFCP